MAGILQRGFLAAALFLVAAICLPAEIRAQAPPVEGMGGAPEAEKESGLAISDPLEDEFVNMSVQETVARQYRLRTPELQPQQLGSLFFTQWQYSLLQEAKKGFQSRPTDSGDNLVEEQRRMPGIRELSLGGIVYADSKAWTVWLNGQRVTPEAIPEHVIDIQVMKEFIELKWFDTYSNLIYPVRLRPHQRFNLDTRMFLPGEGRL